MKFIRHLSVLPAVSLERSRPGHLAPTGFVQDAH